MSKHEYDKNLYSGADIQRYLSGQMTAQEMYALEKAALEDAFLADAIDGYAIKDEETNRRNLLQLNKVLAQRTVRSNSFLSYKRVWQSAAAIILLLAGIYTVGLLLKKDNDRQLAIVKSPPAAVDTLPLQTPVPSASDNEMIRQQKISKNVQDDLKPVLPNNANLRSKPAADQLLREAVPGIQTDTNQKLFNKSLILRGTNAPAKKESRSLDTTFPLLTKRKDTATNHSLEEVVVTDYESRKRKNITSSVSGIEAKALKTAAPVISESAYKAYLDSSKIIPSGEAGIHGPVVVAFTVTRSGRPTDFKIEQSLSPLLDKEAIRLIKDGPKWKSFTNKRTRTTTVIMF